MHWIERLDGMQTNVGEAGKTGGRSHAGILAEAKGRVRFVTTGCKDLLMRVSVQIKGFVRLSTNEGKNLSKRLSIPADWGGWLAGRCRSRAGTGAFGRSGQRHAR